MTDELSAERAARDARHRRMHGVSRWADISTDEPSVTGHDRPDDDEDEPPPDLNREGDPAFNGAFDRW